MQIQPWNVFTAEQEERFGGAYRVDSMTPYSLLSLTKEHDLSATLSLVDAEEEYHNWFATIEVTAANNFMSLPSVACRIACIYLISKLKGDALREGFDALLHNYEWQQNRETPASQPEKKKIATTTRVVRRDPRPFVFDQDD
jgi:hypothetical protein